MGNANGNANSVYFGRFGKLSPCLTGLQFWSSDLSTNGLYLNDKSGLNNHALITQSNALTFDGIDDYVNLGTLGYTSDTFANSVRYMFIIKKTEYTNIQVVFSKKSASFKDGLECSVQNGMLRFLMRTQLAWNTPSSILTANNTYIVYFTATTANGGSATCLINGVSVTMTKTGTDAQTSPFFIDANDFRVGMRPQKVLKYNGLIFALKIDIDGVEKVNCDFAEGAGDRTYCKRNPLSPGIMSGFNLANCWVKQDVYHNNINNGFDLWKNDVTPTIFLRVPFDVNGNSIKTSGDTIPGYIWLKRCPKAAGHNLAESLLTLPTGVADFNAITSNPLWLSTIFAKDNTNSYTKILTYSSAPTGECLTQTQKYVGL